MNGVDKITLCLSAIIGEIKGRFGVSAQMSRQRCVTGNVRLKFELEKGDEGNLTGNTS